MRRTAVLNIVGLTDRCIGEHTPRIRAFAERSPRTRVKPVLPALTCSAQATYATGTLPTAHGIVANGWYDREYAEHRFWKQPESLIQAPLLWDALRAVHPEFTCAKVFWWFNMVSSADITLTPRPLYPADGRKVFDIHTQPMVLREQIKAELGPFPFPQFWGPAAGLKSSEWIARAAQWVEEHHAPTLNLVYLPHLDYNLQRLGPDSPHISQDLREIDAIVGRLIDFFEARQVSVILLSEYGITAVDRPVHLNRLFRQQGWLSIKNELRRETLDLGGCRAVAIADHQIAHIVVRDRDLLPAVRSLLADTPGVDAVLDSDERKQAGLDHPRAGDLVAVADARSWFTYYYWNDDAVAPDFARCVDIHRKCGYDPVELFLDPSIRFPKLKIATRLAKKMMGFRMLMDVIPLDASLVKGSHGRVPEDTADWPILIGDLPLASPTIDCTEVYGLLLQHLS